MICKDEDNSHIKSGNQQCQLTKSNKGHCLGSFTHIFRANIEYPPGFHKQKAGIAGTVGTELTSYINAVIQLLAHLSPFYQICEATDLKSIKDQCLLQAFLSINKIRSGIYRIVETKAIEKQLLLQNPNFRKYSYKTPSLFIYEILRAFSQ